MQYTAVVENSDKQRSILTLNISGADPHAAFDWCCQTRGLKRVGRIKEQAPTPLKLTHVSESILSRTLGAIRKAG